MTEEEDKADADVTSKCKKCPPCITTSGRIVPPKTLGYRPLDVIPDDKMEHGVYGSHHIARGYNNSTAWCFDCKKDNFGVSTNKCNKYVYDVTKEAAATGEITIKGTKRAPLAAEQADKNTKIKNWRVLKDGETLLPGDVAAYKLEGGGASFSGHTGLMISNGSGGLTNISAHGDAVYPTPNQFESNPSTVYRRYTGE